MHFVSAAAENKLPRAVWRWALGDGSQMPPSLLNVVFAIVTPTSSWDSSYFISSHCTTPNIQIAIKLKRRCSLIQGEALLSASEIAFMQSSLWINGKDVQPTVTRSQGSRPPTGSLPQLPGLHVYAMFRGQNCLFSSPQNPPAPLLGFLSRWFLIIETHNDKKKTTKNKTHGRFRNKLYERKKMKKKSHSIIATIIF